MAGGAGRSNGTSCVPNALAKALFKRLRANPSHCARGGVRMKIRVEIVPPEDVPEEVWDWIEYGNYDGVALDQWKVMICPICGEYGQIVWAWNSGHGKHYAWRCKGHREHQGPLIKLPEEDAWIFGQYVHPMKLTYAIDPMVA